MASIYKQPKSNFWWIKFRDPRTGKIERKSTKLGFDSANTRRARQMESEYTFNESQIPTTSRHERWDHWVGDYLNSRCGPGKYARYKVAWRTLRMFLEDKKIEVPRQLLREHCLEYFDWRSKPDKRLGKYKAGHNTALLEVKVMRILMSEAVLRRYAPFNPWREMRIKRTRVKEKPEYPPEALNKIMAAIEKESEPQKTFFRNSFMIARYHGCRLSETHLDPINDVHFSGDNHATITFIIKGGKIHTVNLHPKLFPLFKQLRADGKTETYPARKSASKDWYNFLTRAGIKKEYPGSCFHSLRVTAATMLARKGVTEKMAMSYIGHASTTVHRTYVHLKADDLTKCADALA